MFKSFVKVIISPFEEFIFPISTLNLGESSVSIFASVPSTIKKAPFDIQGLN